MSLCELVADAIPRQSGEPPLRVVAMLSEGDVESICQVVSGGLKRMLMDSKAKLQKAFQESDKKANSSGASKFDLIALSCGTIADFHKGIEGRIDTPNVKFLLSMQAEHCSKPDSDKTFTTSNYHVTTTPRAEWIIVVPSKSTTSSNQAPLPDLKHGRIIPRIEDLMQKEVARVSKLGEFEVIAVVLYTGPMFQIYNLILRRFPRDKYDQLEKSESLYSTTIYVLVSAIQKIAREVKLPAGTILYRGLGGDKTLPSFFYKSDSKGCKGITEWGFMSTTCEKSVALQYSGIRSGKPFPTILEIVSGAVDRGAVITEFSQYPGEKECLFSPCSFLEPLGGEAVEVSDEGVVGKIRIRLNMNIKSRTCEDLLNQKKELHLSSFKYLIDEITQEVSKLVQDMPEERVKRDQRADSITIKRTLIEKTIQQCKQVFETHSKHPSEHFTDDEAFRALVIEMLEVKVQALAKIEWYILDQKQSALEMQRTSLREAQRGLAGHWEEACRKKGLLVKSVEETDEEGRVRIIKAAAENLPAEDLGLLVRAGADVKYRDKSGCTPVFAAAAMSGCLSIRRPLGATGVSRPMATIADAELRSVETIRALVSLGADIHVPDNNGNSPLHVAAATGRCAVVEALVKLGAEVNRPDLQGRTPIHLAAYNGNCNTIELLVKLGADPSKADNEGGTALLVASHRGQSKSIKTLIKLRVDIHQLDNHQGNAVHAAAAGGHCAVIEMLHELGVNINQEGVRGTTPLCLAAGTGRCEAIEKLVKLGVSVNALSSTQDNAAHHAAHGGQCASLKTLIKLGTDVDHPNSAGITPLMVAALSGTCEVIELLVKDGTDVNKGRRKPGGETAIHFAADRENFSALDLLVKLGGNIDARDENGMSAVFHAARRGKGHVIDALAKLGADINAVAADGSSPLFTARLAKQPSAISALTALDALELLPRQEQPTHQP